MFVNSSDYEKTLKSIVSEEGELLLAVAFWGQGAESIIYPKRRGSLRIICNLRSGATNPDTINSLRQKKGVELKQHDRLHAKVIVGSKTALIGSANLSSNGLNLESDEIQGWEEAGLVTQDSQLLESIRQWFAVLWQDAHTISDKDLEEARVRWLKRRITRIKSTMSANDGFKLDGLTRSELKERSIFFAIYNGYLSDEAKAAYRKKQKELTGQPVARSAKLPPMYEGWPQLPKNSQLIDIYYGPRGALKCYGVFKRTLNINFKYKDGSKGHLAICRKDDDILGQRFGSKEASILAESLKPHIDAIWNSPMAKGDESGKFISLADVIQICG